MAGSGRDKIAIVSTVVIRCATPDHQAKWDAREIPARASRRTVRCAVRGANQTWNEPCDVTCILIAAGGGSQGRVPIFLVVLPTCRPWNVVVVPRNPGRICCREIVILEHRRDAGLVGLIVNQIRLKVIGAEIWCVVITDQNVATSQERHPRQVIGIFVARAARTSIDPAGFNDGAGFVATVDKIPDDVDVSTRHNAALAFDQATDHDITVDVDRAVDFNVFVFVDRTGIDDQIPIEFSVGGQVCCGGI